MNAIFKKENVYVAIKGKDTREDIQCEEMDTLIFATHYEYEKQKVYLYGGRVYLENYGYNGLDIKISIDGIPIREISYNNKDSIENLGIDSFLDNYKSQLQEFKKDLEAQAEKIEQEQSIQFNEDKSTFLVSLRRFINELSCIIFCLLINMNAGLDNQFYTDAYNEIINLYF